MDDSSSKLVIFPRGWDWFRFTGRTENINTLEGIVRALPGDAVLTGTRGENWPIKRETFEATYDLDPLTGVCSKKAIRVEVEEMDEPFEVTVGWADQPIIGAAGDFKVTYKPGDFGVVARDIFKET